MMFRTILILLLLTAGGALRAQSKNFTANSDVFGLRNFIENKGQFEPINWNGGKVFYAYEYGDEKIYFTERGLTYKLTETVREEDENEERDEEEEREYEKRRSKPAKVYYVNMNWVGCNSNILITNSEKQSHYFTYGESKLNSSGYKIIRYVNVYNHIDIEYTIPKDQAYGIKYNIILHPGANPDDIKIKYSGHVKKIENISGEVVVHTPLVSITEHTPKTYYENGEELPCNFNLKNNLISYSFPNGRDSIKRVIIDPWVTSFSILSVPFSAYDVDYDNIGNVYAYGCWGGNICKYSTNGGLLWTFQGVISAASWTAQMTGNLVVTKYNGKVYTGHGFNGPGVQVVRLDSSGNYDNFITPAVNNWTEMHDIGYHCISDKVYGLGGSVTTSSCTGLIDQTTSTVTTVSYASPTNFQQDVVCHASDNQGNLFLLFASNANQWYLNNKMAKINSALTATVWLAPTTFSTLAENGNKGNYISSPGSSNGFNALAVSPNFLYYYDGSNLAAYNKTTGAIISSTVIAGYQVKYQGGIAVDDCDNLYVGGNNGELKCFHFNGSSFITLSDINLNPTSTNKFVYDVKLDKYSNILYVCGSAFVSKTPAIHSSNCLPLMTCDYATPTLGYSICLGSAATVSITNFLNLSNPSYSIQPGSTVQSSAIFTVSPTTSTSYTLFITGTSSLNTTVTYSSIANLQVLPVPLISPLVTSGTCQNPTTNSVNLNITFTPNISTNYTVNWSPLPSTVTSVNSGTAAGLQTGINHVTVVTAGGCSATASFSVPPSPLPANFIIVNPGNDYTITCANPNVLLTTSVTNGVPLSYTWFPGCSPTVVASSANFTQNCIGQVVGTSSTGCIFTQTFTIYQDFTSPTIAVTPSVSLITCSSSPSTFTGTSNLGPNVTTNWFQVVGSNTVYVGAAQGTVNLFQPGQPGVYWFESVNNLTGCKTTMSVQVLSSIGVPMFTVTSPTSFTIGCASKSITSMQVTTVITSPIPNVPVNYTFMIPPVTSTPTTFSIQPNLNNISMPGTYVVYVKDLTNNCVSSQSISIIQNTIAPNVYFIQPLSILSCKDPSMVLQGISSNTNTQISWTVPAGASSSINPTPNATVFIDPAISGATNNITSIGTLTVGAVDNNNSCASSRTVQVLQDIRVPRFTITALSNSVISCKNSDVVIVPVVTPSLAAALVPTYVWYPPVGNPLPGSQFNTTSAGTHTALATSVVNGCTALATYVVASDLVPPTVDPQQEPFILDCNTNPQVLITTSITGPTNNLNYLWTVPQGALTSNLSGSSLTSNMMGSYVVTITNTLNGCVSQAIYQVVEGGIVADFVASSEFGYAPLAVTFTNTSSTSTGASNIISSWGYGNGAVTSTVYNNVITSTTYSAPGTYSVILKVKKGNCVGEIQKVIVVEFASKMEVPNVFTPNKDGVNDVFRLRATALKEIYITIFDRWGSLVYELTSDTGNFAWDGKDPYGKECADGVYFYIIKATGNDNKEFEQKGNVSLFR